MDDVGEQIRSILARRLDRPVTSIRPVVGGDINRAYRAETPDGPLFVKTRAGAAPGTYRQEAAGLHWLGEAPDGPPVAEVALLHDPPASSSSPGLDEPRFLALHWIEAGPHTPEADARFGRALAYLHATPAPAFGAFATLDDHGILVESPRPRSLRIADVVLPTHEAPTFAEFWAEQRVLPLAEQAHAAGTLTSTDLAELHRLAARMPELVGPAEPPARTHGDLWGGNLITDPAGLVHLVDPVAHGSHREVDLATLRVFGGPSERCFDAYREVFPLAAGWQERIALMQLGIMLLHVVLFGGAYAGRARQLAARYR